MELTKEGLVPEMMISDPAVRHTTLNVLTAQKIAKAAKLNFKDPVVITSIINHMYDIEADLRRLRDKEELLRMRQEEEGCGCDSGGECCQNSSVRITND
jgi:hypothetical protein